MGEALPAKRHKSGGGMMAAVCTRDGKSIQTASRLGRLFLAKGDVLLAVTRESRLAYLYSESIHRFRLTISSDLRLICFYGLPDVDGPAETRGPGSRLKLSMELHISQPTHMASIISAARVD